MGKKDSCYGTGMYAAQPEDFDQPWPTLRSEKIEEKVLAAIKRLGAPTFDEIVLATRLNEDQVGVALAALAVGRGKRVGSVDTNRKQGREYFVIGAAA